MALMLGAIGSDVLAWRGTADLFAILKRDLAEEAAFLLDSEGTNLYREFRDKVTAEMVWEERFAEEVRQTFSDLEEVGFDDQLAVIAGRFHHHARAYFEKRGSVAALHALCNASGDALIRKTLQLVEKGLLIDEAGLPPVPYCCFVAGAAGRYERTLRDVHRHFLVYDDAGNGSSAYFDAFIYRFTAILKKAGIIPGSERDFLRTGLWRGTRREWQEWLVRELEGKKHDHLSLLPGLPSLSIPFRPLDREDDELFQAISTVADLRLLAGQEELAADVLATGRSVLNRFRHTPLFEYVGRQVAVLPVALSLFGRFKVERGTHRGQFNVDRQALNPLVMNLCLLAVKYGLDDTGTIERVRALLGAGHLSVDLAEKVVRAYHEIVRQKMLLQMRETTVLPSEPGARPEPEEAYLTPEDLSEEEGQTLKMALEAVVTLQKIVLHDFSENM